MTSGSSSQVIGVSEPPRFFLRAWFDGFVRRHPFVGLVLAILVSNAAATVFSFTYNTLLIVETMTPAQKSAFWDVTAPIYNAFAWTIGFGVLFYIVAPMTRCLRKLRQGEAVDGALLELCQRRLINLPIVQLTVNFGCTVAGAIFFPAVVTLVGGTDDSAFIWVQFCVSFVIFAIFTTVQTFFILQAYLTAYLYPEFFQQTRPETVPGIWRIPFVVRLVMLWAAVALMPLVAILAVALNFAGDNRHRYPNWYLPVIGPSLLMVSALSGGGIFWLVGRDLRRWIRLQTEATWEIAAGNFGIRIDQPRPDEWGRLTNRFNDMAVALNRAWESHETLGQLVSPEVRDEILRRMTGFDVQLQLITVLFVDIRGFTPRCAGQAPEKIGALLNRFLTLALRSVEEKGGYVNKFLGDGVMALFGATNARQDHADLAVASAQEMLDRLRDLNADLATQGEAPLVIGIGIHTGPALVGCFGAMLQGDDGKPIMRREFTAIGETVNFCQRLEQLTKKCGGPILISDGTRRCLLRTWALVCLGPQDLPGSPEPMVVYRVESA
ncbi:MAG: hypothetical protein HY289_16140 [Planctomycetes bacterium]|nr:hypothetical protein [Planctomycetota bacterium]